MSSRKWVVLYQLTAGNIEKYKKGESELENRADQS